MINVRVRYMQVMSLGADKVQVAAWVKKINVRHRSLYFGLFNFNPDNDSVVSCL